MPTSNETECFSAIDWAKDAHAVAVLDATGSELIAREFAHSEEGLRELTATLLAAGARRVALERPDGLLCDRLLAAGLCVVAVHPNKLASARERHSASGKKSDRFDAYVLADLLRTDGHRFPSLRPDGDETKAIRALSRTREDLVKTRVALANQLRAQLEACWAGAAVVFAEVDSPIALAFIARYPSPHDARALGEKRLASFLGRHSYCGRRSPAELLARLRAAPEASCGEVEAEARRQAVLALVAVLGPLVEQIKLLEAELGQAVRTHADGELFGSLFKTKAAVCAAALLGEIGDVRGRYPSAHALAADAGMVPVSKSSGRSRTVSFRWACDKRLRAAVACLADTTRHHHPWAQSVYRRARARGCDHQHAIRILGRAWLRVIWRMWQDRVPYDPSLHRGLQQLNPVGG
ncbi:MAG TPA: IS110 family transposase [Solirubrobacteraceae bacterium]|nr:IS110 family transposase [Solirubrobacteraceae bacterium]